MKKKMLNVMLAAMMTTSMFGSVTQETRAAETAEGEDQSALAELTFGNGWKIDMSKDYSGSQYKRFDGLEFTRIVNTGGYDLPEGMTIDDNDRVWMFELKSGMVPKTLWSANGDAYSHC